MFWNKKGFTVTSVLSVAKWLAGFKTSTPPLLAPAQRAMTPNFRNLIGESKAKDVTKIAPLAQKGFDCREGWRAMDETTSHVPRYLGQCCRLLCGDEQRTSSRTVLFGK